MVDWSKLVYGSAFVVGGLGAGYLSKTFIPEKWRPAGYVGALGLGVYGLYSIYKAFKEEEGEVPTPNLTFPIVITDPTPGEKWSTLLPHTINIEVQNPYEKAYVLFIGMSMIHDGTGEVYDYPIQQITTSPNKMKRLSWWVTDYYGGFGLHWIVSAVWDVLPTGDCEAQNTCHRLGEAESNVEFGLIG